MMARVSRCSRGQSSNRRPAETSAQELRSRASGSLPPVAVVRGGFRREPPAKAETPIGIADDAAQAGFRHAAGEVLYPGFLKQVGAYLGRPVISEVPRVPDQRPVFVTMR